MILLFINSPLKWQWYFMLFYIVSQKLEINPTLFILVSMIGGVNIVRIQIHKTTISYKVSFEMQHL